VGTFQQPLNQGFTGIALSPMPLEVNHAAHVLAHWRHRLIRSVWWPPIIADAQASLGDLRALSNYDFNAEHFRELQVPVMLQIGSESPRDLYVTGALAAILPNVRIEALPGQAHRGVTTVPKMYVEVVSRFLLPQARGPIA
jgi:hypothetical protein